MWESLEELGQALRAERERKYLSVEDVADGLKISSRVLRAIEAGDAASLPHAVYVRGFVAAYGKFLELDVQELLATPALYDTDEVQKTSTIVTPAVGAKKISLPLIPVFILICVLAMGAGGFWLYNNTTLFVSLQEKYAPSAEPAPALKEEATSSTAPSTSPSAAASTDSAQTASQASAKSASPAQAGQMQEKSSAQKSVAAQPIAQEPVATQAVQSVQSERAGQAQGTASQVIAAASAQEGPHKIIVTALSNTWIHSTADGAGLRQFALKPGDTFALTFDSSLQLKIGNVGGVRIHYNGVAVPSLGQDGEEKTVNFPPK